MIFDRWYSKGQVKVFNHWMRAMMRSQVAGLYQHILVLVYKELKDKK